MCFSAAARLRLQRRGVAGALVLPFHLHAFVSHPSLLAALVHVVCPLRAGAAAATRPFAVYEAPPAGGEGSPASTAVVHPGFLPVSIIVLGNNREVVINVLQSDLLCTLTTDVGHHVQNDMTGFS